MSMPGKHRHAQQIPRPPVVALAVDDAVAVTLQEANDRFDCMAVSKRAPILSFFGMGRDNIVPESMRMIVRSEPRVDDVNMFVFAQLFFDVGPLKKNFLSFAAPLLVLGEFYTVHRQFGVTFLH